MARRKSRTRSTSSVARTRKRGAVRKQRTSRRTVDRDAIRVVPLVPHEAAIQPSAAPPPQLTYRKGPLLGAVEVFTVFWGAAWASAAQKPVAAKLNAFFDAILTSALVDQLAEYSTTGTSIRHGRRIGSASIATGLPAKSLSDSAIQAFLKQQIASGKLPKPGANTLYFLYVAPGVRVVMGGSASCQSFCGYHNAIGKTTFYAVMPYPGCKGCTGQLSAFDALTSTSSHELCEAVTDPIPGQGWYDDAHGEIGDICAWQTKSVAGYTVQLEWSNAANKCV